MYSQLMMHGQKNIKFYVTISYNKPHFFCWFKSDILYNGNMEKASSHTFDITWHTTVTISNLWCSRMGRKFKFATISPDTRMKSLLITAFPSKSRIASPSERQVSDTITVIVIAETSSFHLFFLQNCDITYTP